MGYVTEKKSQKRQKDRSGKLQNVYLQTCGSYSLNIT